MKLIGREKLTNLKGVNDEIDMWITAWITEITSRRWFTHVELQYDYPKMKIIENEKAFVFPIASSNYNVKVCIYFKKSIALITEIQRIENSHA